MIVFLLYWKNHFLSILNQIHVIVMKINIKDIDDELMAAVIACSSDSFAFGSPIATSEMADGDFLVHKAWLKWRFPSKISFYAWHTF